MAPQDKTSEPKTSGLERVIGISDAVFAFAVTLLVIELTVPVLSAGATSIDLLQALSGEWITFLSFLLSFFIAGIWWNVHHQNFRVIQESDNILRWLNLVFLLWIVLLPLFTKILYEYSYLPIAISLYALDQAAAGLCMSFTWWYASRNHRLVDKNMKQSAIKSTLLINLIAPSLFLVSVGLSFINPVIAIASWIAIFPLIGLAHRYHPSDK